VKRRVRWPIAAALILIVAGCGPQPPWGGTLGPGVFVVETDGSRPEEVAGGDARAPAWSPDGRRLAVVRGGSRLEVIDLDGGDRTVSVALPADPGDDPPVGEGAGRPAWSPDGTRIAVSAGGGGPTYVVGADGNGRVRVAPGGRQLHASGWPPAWSPDSTRLALALGRGTALRITVVMADGSGSTPVTADLTFANWAPAWSPNGEAIAFLAADGVYVIRPDGSGLTRLVAAEPDPYLAPRWSPNGARLLFSGRAGGGAGGLWVVNADGTGLDAVVGSGSQGADAAWSPDGTRIAYVTVYQPQILWTVQADGSGKRQLAEFGTGVLEPAWSPGGDRIAVAALRDERHD
jgi:Tol biopolymer transport system component